MDRTRTILFCPGIPGAGKTIIASIVVDHLHRNFPDNTSVGIAYLYCNFRRQQEQNPRVLLSSLPTHFTQRLPSIPEGLESLYRLHKGAGTLPSSGKISKTLQSVRADYSGSFIIIDALDEYSKDSRDQFLSEIFKLRAETGVRPLYHVTTCPGRREGI